MTVRGTGRPSKYKMANGTVVPGVTTIVNRFKDSGGLLHWAWSQGMDGIDYRRSRDAAGDAGTLAHALIEGAIHGESTSLSDVASELVDKAMNAFANFNTWREQTHLEMLTTELPLVSEKYAFGGTIDAIGSVMGAPCLVDWKTSNAVYPDYLVQVSAYVHLYEEHHPDTMLDGVHLLRIDKEFAGFHHHFWGRSVVEVGWKYFLLAREMYELDKTLKRAV